MPEGGAVDPYPRQTHIWQNQNAHGVREVAPPRCGPAAPGPAWRATPPTNPAALDCLRIARPRAPSAGFLTARLLRTAELPSSRLCRPHRSFMAFLRTLALGAVAGVPGVAAGRADADSRSLEPPVFTAFRGDLERLRLLEGYSRKWAELGGDWWMPFMDGWAHKARLTLTLTLIGYRSLTGGSTRHGSPAGTRSRPLRYARAPPAPFDRPLTHTHTPMRPRAHAHAHPQPRDAHSWANVPSTARMKRNATARTASSRPTCAPCTRSGRTPGRGPRLLRRSGC